jgi:hypothetical protein
MMPASFPRSAAIGALALVLLAGPALAQSAVPVVPPPSTTLGSTIPGTTEGPQVSVKTRIVLPPGAEPVLPAAPAPAAAAAATTTTTTTTPTTTTPSRPAKPAASDETASITAPAKPATPAAGAATTPAKPAVATGPKLKNCIRLGFSVNDYGKDGPTKDAIRLFEAFVPKWAEHNGIKTYKVGKQDVSCKLFLDFIVFDEHTCRAEADVCWNGGPKADDTTCPNGKHDCE